MPRKTPPAAVSSIGHNSGLSSGSRDKLKDIVSRIETIESARRLGLRYPGHLRRGPKGREMAVGATKDALKAAVGYKYDRQSGCF
jgi:hypothetical protein